MHASTRRVGPEIIPSGLNAGPPQALASVANLTGIEADVLPPGHGEPWTGGVEEAISQARNAGPSCPGAHKLGELKRAHATPHPNGSYLRPSVSMPHLTRTSAAWTCS